MQHHPIFIPGPAGRLQALYKDGAEDRPAVVVCHPHPRFGGTMRNKVVYWVARTFENLGCSVLRFNFRGVEQSDGEWDAGRGEVDDVRAALNWLHDMHPDSPLWLAGFSFGTYAGLQAAQSDPRIERMFAVAPAVNLWNFSFLDGETRPLTVVMGTADELVPFANVEAWVAKHPHINFQVIEGAGHFFPQHLEELQHRLLDGVMLG